MAKKEALPMNIDLNDMEPGSNIIYSGEVVSIIAGVAASEVEGIAGMVNVPNSGLLGKNRNVTKGIYIHIGYGYSPLADDGTKQLCSGIYRIGDTHRREDTRPTNYGAYKNCKR